MKKMNMMFLVLFFGFAAAISHAAPGKAAEKPLKGAAVVADGKIVKVSYVLTVDNKVVDSSKAGQPLEFRTGAHQMIPGFERAVMGMRVGEKKSFKVKPKDGYGPVDAKAVREVSKKKFPADFTPKAGMTLIARGKGGKQLPVKIKEVRKDTVVIDVNHPLAGKTLHFDVQVVAIR